MQYTSCRDSKVRACANRETREGFESMSHDQSRVGSSIHHSGLSSDSFGGERKACYQKFFRMSVKVGKSLAAICQFVWLSNLLRKDPLDLLCVWTMLSRAWGKFKSRPSNCSTLAFTVMSQNAGPFSLYCTGPCGVCSKKHRAWCFFLGKLASNTRPTSKGSFVTYGILSSATVRSQIDHVCLHSRLQVICYVISCWHLSVFSNLNRIMNRRQQQRMKMSRKFLCDCICDSVVKYNFS